ncbi:Lovastatin diketide synthase LovF [Madurella mycetomatis]|uniref:Lovastatin diketide synthase LovF n=1 Tax=Madurella mycetomatis TaxID=100816 RepID=A0A175VZM2_9PEZI|nr:Lovastatin diketide synthase LovF [Madurella mycetomatis]
MTIDNRDFRNGTHHSNGVNGFDSSNGYINPDGNDGGRPKNLSSPLPIAIVGMACRFAGDATNPEKLWDLCSSGRDAWSRIPGSRFDVESLYDPNSEKPGRVAMRIDRGDFNHAIGGYFLQEDMAAFDAAFFNFTADVASAMDPQLRMLLEVVYEATEDAGLPIEKLAGPGPNTSVFVGCYTKDYHDLQTRDPETMPSSTLTGNYTAMFSNRVSHFYDFQGASMSIDTGCSAALAALHQGCQTIRSGESSVSIIGASNVILNPDIYIAMSSLGMVGADGRCYAWDSRAQGYGRGEGVAVLVLKSLDAALRDGDRVHAVIRNSALNQDGRTTTITSPSLEAQIRLIRDCYRAAGLDLSETGYVEAHMTGTQAGDATEAESLARTFGMSRDVHDPVWVGSVKTNVGHTEGVSGLAGIIKAVMAMKHQSIPPNLNYVVGNSKIPLENWHLRVPTELVPWPSDKPLRASINNFGYGGTNAHVILEGPPEYGIQNGSSASVDDYADDASRIYILSAQDSATIRNMASNLASYLRHGLETGAAPSPAALAYTLSSRRSRLSYVAAIRAESLPSLAELLSSPAALRISHCPPTKAAPRLGFVFNGQGAQWHAMGRELLTAYPVFAAAIEEADFILRGYGADWSLREELLRDAKTSRVSEIHLGQPITVALQLCLVFLLREWGIRPTAVTSHSSGEIAAAYAAGALSFEQALGVTYWRGELARSLLDHKVSGLVGGMAAGGVGADEAERYVVDTKSGGKAVVACVNSPESVTFAGDVDDLNEVVARLEADGKFVRKLNVPLAYHSHHMLRMADAYTEKLREIVPSKPTWSGSVMYTSPVTGGIIASPDMLTPEHYVRNLTSPVLFSQAFEAMCFGPDGDSAAQVDAIVEIGPHSTLSAPIRQILGGRKMAYVSCLKRSVDAVSTMQDLGSELFRLGYPVALDIINHCFPSNSTFVHDLPSYPWNHASRYWVESRINRDIRFKTFPPHELLGLPVSGATTPAWRNFLRLADLPWVGDHRVDGVAVLPGAAYVSMAIEAVRLVSDPSAGDIKRYLVRDVEFLSALTVPETGSSSGDAVEMHLSLRPRQDEVGWFEFDVESLGTNGVWVGNCRGLVSAVVSSNGLDDAVVQDVESFLGDNVQYIDGPTLRTHVAEMSIEYGPAFQGLSEGRFSTTNRAATELRIQGPQESESPTTSYVIHPTTLDCIVQATYTNLPPGTGKMSIVLPRSLRAMTLDGSLSSKPGHGLVVLSELYEAQRKGYTSRVSVIDSELLPDHSNTVQLRVEGLFCQAIPRRPLSGPSILLSTTRWEPDTLHSIPTAIKEAMRTILSDKELDIEKKLVRASYHLIADAVSGLEGQNQNLDAWTPRQRALFNWMKAVVTKGKSGQLATRSKMWARASKGVKQMLFDELKAGGAYGDLLVRVGSRLAGIVGGDIEVGEALKQDEGDSQNQYLQLPPRVQVRSHKHLARLLQLFAVKNPGAKVLEIGAGAGAATQVALEAFSPRSDGGSLIGGYIATNPSFGPLEGVKTKLASWANMIEFRELDIEKDPLSAGLAAHSFDLILASTAMQAVENREQALLNIRKLLRPDGKLILVELTQDRLDAQLIFGALSDWKTEGDEPAQAIKVQQWDELLRATGFTGVEFDIGDCDQPQFQGSSVILTTAAASEEEGHASESAISIVVPSLLGQPTQWITKLTEAIRAETGITAAAETLDSVNPSDKTICILTDIANGETILDSLNKSNFFKLRRVLTTSSGILWLTTSGGAIDAPSPTSAQVQGLLRTLRQEDTSKAYMLLDLPRNWTQEPELAIGHIVHVLKRTLSVKIKGLTSTDWEYAVKDSILHVPRIYSAQDDSKNESDVALLQPFHQPGRVLVWEDLAPEEPGFIEDSPRKSIPDDMVEIETRAFSADLFSSHGDHDEMPGVYEVAGVITRLGKHALADGLQVGDNVCGVVKAPFASAVRAARTSIAKIPDGLSLSNAVCVPLAYAAAYYALGHVARLQRGEKVLILHTAGSHDMEAALAVARHIGAEPLFVAATEAEAQLLVDKYRVPSGHVLSRQGTNSITTAIVEKANFKGVDVLITSQTSSPLAPLLQSALESIARFGRFVEVGGSGKGIDLAALAARCVAYGCVDVLHLAEHNGQLMKEALEASLDIIGGDYSSHATVTKVPVSQIDRALEYVHQRRQGGQVGKVIVVPQDGELVKVLSRARPLSLNDEDSTYLVVGGVGAIGGAVAAWMASKGAKNVVVVSRNAEAHPKGAIMVQEAAAKGCRLQFLNCDIASEESLVALLSKVSAVLPPIRGVVHAASVLDDTIFENMTFSQWQRATAPKIAGVSNLQKHLPAHLSFFVLLSSITGVAGHPSQANYAAANTFEDAFARHRASLGLAATSLDLPAITGVGMVADDNGAQQRIEALGTKSISIESVLDLIDTTIQQQSSNTQDNVQVIVGLLPWNRLPADAAIRRDSRFGTLRLAESSTSSAASSTQTTSQDPTSLLVRTISSGRKIGQEGKDKVAEALAARLATIFNVPVESVDVGVAVAAHGVDSLVAIELRNWLASAAKAKLSIFDILQSASLRGLAELVIGRSALAPELNGVAGKE